MIYHNLSKPLQERIRKYFHFIHANSVLNENEILNWLSPTLRQDVTIQIKAHLVRSVPFLTHIDKVFLSEVCLCAHIFCVTYVLMNYKNSPKKS